VGALIAVLSIRLLRFLIPQFPRGDFFDSIDPKRTRATSRYFVSARSGHGALDLPTRG
jgi:hypothetical protein